MISFRSIDNRGLPSRWFVLAIALLVLLVSGCPDDGDGDREDGAQPQTILIDTWCASDAECPAQEHCIQGLCSIELPDTSVDYGLVITPPNRSSMPTQRVGVDSRPALDAEVTLEHVDPIDGVVLTPDEEPAPNGTLVIEPGDAPTPAEPQPPVRDGEFETELVAGEYHFTYIVDDRRWPRIPLGTRDISATTTDVQFTVPTLADLRVVTGEITRDVVDLLDLVTEPVPGAEIAAVGVDTGFRSTVAISDEDGEFILRLPPGEDRFDVLVSPGPDTPLVPHLSFSEEITATTDDISISIGEFELDTASLSLQLAVESVDDHSPQWADYRVNIRRSLALGELLVTPSLDESGHAEIDLLLGTYDIEVITPPGSPWSGASTEVDIVAGSSPVALELPARQHVEGTVTDHTGEDLESARITVESMDSNRRPPPPVYSDASGQFEVWLDPGEFRATVQPPSASGLPRIQAPLTVSDNEESTPLTIEIPRGFVATGVLHTSRGEPISHATVRAYQSGENGERRIIGETLSDAGGAFRLLLSPQLVAP